MPIGIYMYTKKFEPKKLEPLPVPKTKQEIYEEYKQNLPVHNEVFTLVSGRIAAETVKRMRVRSAKPGKGAKGASLDVLARAERHFDEYGNIYTKRNENFGKFGEHKATKSLIGVKIGGYKAEQAFFPTLLRRCKRAKTNVHNCHLEPLYAIKNTNRGFIYAESLKPVKQLTKLHSSAFVSVDAFRNTNSLLRQILLFKGIGFGQIEQDLHENNFKPVTYGVNTTIEYDPYRTNDVTEIMCFKVHNITVKKVFRNTILNGDKEEIECRLFFSSDSCRKINVWLQKLEINFNIKTKQP